jgi:glycosyltransferase involved in cell wall biosynthesis
MNSRVAVIADTKGWAFWNAAMGIQRYRPDDVEVGVYTSSTWRNEFESKYDGVLRFSWYESKPCKNTRTIAVVSHHGACHPRWKHSFVSWMQKSIDDWRGISSTNIRNLEEAQRKLPKFDGVIFTNHRLHKELGLYCESDKNGISTVTLPLGVDTNFWTRSKTTKPSGFVKIGWCGQCTPGIANNKGYDWILLPLIQSLSSENLPIDWRILGTNNNGPKLSPEEMRIYYNSLDLFLVTSIHEGTPCTAFEAMACGVPVLTTDVGDIADFLEHNANNKRHSLGRIHYDYINYQTSKRTVKELHNRVESLLEAKNILRMEERDRQLVHEQRSWEVLAPQWIDFILGR